MPSAEIAARYARVLGVSIEWLVNGEGEGPSEAA